MIEVERQNGINNRQCANRQNKTYKELLIANYPIKKIYVNKCKVINCKILVIYMLCIVM